MKAKAKTLASKRSVPRQERSRLVLDAILEAAAQVLEANGTAAFNTNAVAERAGVSIGTLYRYLANKEAILAELAERELNTLREDVRKALAAQTDGAPDRAAIRAFLRAFAGRAAVRRAALLELLARANQRSDETAWVEPLLRDKSGAPLPPLCAFVLARALLGAIRGAVLDRPDLLREKALEDELVRLARSYANQPTT